MKFGRILGVIAACVAATQAQEKSTFGNETQEQQQEQQQELQTSFSASTSKDASYSGSDSSLFDSMSGSETTSSSASNGVSVGDSDSASTSEESAASDERGTSVSASLSGDGSDLVPSGSGEVDQGIVTGSQGAASSSGSVFVGDSSSGSTAPTEAPGPSISVEDSVQLSESLGGPHGTEFSDESMATSGQTVGSVTIRAGKRVDGIALEITGPVATTFNHGGGGGDPKTLTLGAGEYITSMEAHWGKRNGRTRIFYLRFTTSAGNSIEGGSTTESKKTVTAPEGFQLGGFFGRAGDEIDLLGAIWTSIEVVTPAPGAPTPAPTPWAEKKIGHDEVVPFKQPEPVTIAEKAAIKFKPQLHISNGCHAYPAVNIGGQTSGGLKTTGAPSAGCKGSGWGSQVYGRSTWHNVVRLCTG
ncbi:hypothetical protein DVH05_013328 [Phytophthora capsici]|nr:hypothetical protein DVH05_013328 [Phytophthora capsici]